MHPVPTHDLPPHKEPTSPLMAVLVLLYGLALLLSVAMVFRGKFELGVIGTLLVLTLAPLAFILARSDSTRLQRRLVERTDELTRNVRMLADQAVLSDEARRILNRQSERDLLRRAIEEDIEAGDSEAALILIEELSERFGYRADADQLRRKIDDTRQKTVETEITDAIGQLDGLILQRRWNDAFIKATRIQRRYPDSARVEPLRARVQQAQESYKQDLERRFLLASQEDRTEEAITLLKELDQYLTPTEAEPLRELARGVIGKARLNLGAQFKLAVQDRRWAEAARIGDQIIEQFPNSRMAGEVRDVIDGIRTKASGVAPATVLA